MKVLPHTKLGITFIELGALLGTHALMTSKVIHHDPKADNGPIPTDDHTFNMGISCRTQGCGSVSCIGGTMGLIMGMNQHDASRYVNYTKDGGIYTLTDNERHHSPRLKTLFMPHIIDSDCWPLLSTRVVLKVIEHFLATGRVAWEKFTPKKYLIARSKLHR